MTNYVLQLLLNQIKLSIISIALAAQIPSASFVVLPECPEAPIVTVQADVRTYLVSMAKCNDIPDSKLLWIAQHESRFGFNDGKYNPAIRGPEKVGASYCGVV